MDKNIHWINSAKALSILLIVIFHIGGQLFDAGQYRDGAWKIFRMLTYQGVNVFFLLSGFGLSLSLLSKDKVRWSNWLKTRFERILPLYWFVLILTFISYVLHVPLKITPSGNYLIDFVLHFLLLHIFNPSTYYSINVAWWFVPVIILCYLSLKFTWSKLTLLMEKSRSYKTVGILTLLFFLVSLGYMNRVSLAVRPQIIEGFIFFYLGVIFSQVYNNNIAQWSISILIISSIFTAALCYIPFKSQLLMISLTMVVAICSFSSIVSDFQFFRSLLKKVSEISYPIFLIHWAFIVPVFKSVHFFARNNMPGYVINFLSLVIYLFLIIVISYGLLWIDNNIFRKVFRKLYVK